VLSPPYAPNEHVGSSPDLSTYPQTRSAASPRRTTPAGSGRSTLSFLFSSTINKSAPLLPLRFFRTVWKVGERGGPLAWLLMGYQGWTIS